MNNYIAIIICHGDLAASLKRNITELFGETNLLFPFTNQSKTIESLSVEIEKELDRHTNSKLIFFVDLRGGSCWRLARQLSKNHSERSVLSGVNVPMLIQFLTKSEETNDINELCKFIIEKTKLAIIGE